MANITDRVHAIIVQLRDLGCEMSHITDLLCLEYRHHSFSWGYDDGQHYVKMSGKEVWKG